MYASGPSQLQAQGQTQPGQNGMYMSNSQGNVGLSNPQQGVPVGGPGGVIQPMRNMGHSAGAAIAIRMTLDGLARPQRIAGINAALLPLGGLAGQWFSPAAKLMAAMPLVPRLFAWRAQSPAVLQRLLAGTGSTLDAEGQALYHRLVTDADHAAGALGMMANWDLPQLARDLPRLAVPLDLIVGDRDRTVPPADAREAMQRLAPVARGVLTVLPGLGHLAHEEDAALVSRHLLAPWGPA